MTGTPDGRRDFFVSYTAADRSWAEWIAARFAHLRRELGVDAPAGEDTDATAASLRHRQPPR